MIWRVNRPERRRVTPRLAGFLAGVLAGCGVDEAPRPETVPVKGKVMFRGEPLTKGRISFYPNEGQPAVGAIQPDGTFALSTFEDGDGAVPGHHRVLVSATDGDPSLIPGSPGYKEPKSLVPKRYMSMTDSGLEADVSRERREFTFDLK